MTRVLRWLCDPHTLEAMEGDLAELYGAGDRAGWRYVVDVVSVCNGDNGAHFRIAIKPEGGITWLPRHSVLP